MAVAPLPAPAEILTNAEAVVSRAASVTGPPLAVVPGALPVTDVLEAAIDKAVLRQLGMDLSSLFRRYVSDRQLTELKYMRNLRQYLGVYDPEVDKQLSISRSRAYPRITRVKCISMLSRLMNLMFPGNEDNWELTASPSAEMDPADVQQAVQDLVKRYQEQGAPPPNVDEKFVEAAVQRLANKRAEAVTTLIKDQLQEIGGDQTLDYISLNRKVVMSGILYGVGVLEGPYVREETKVLWVAENGGFVPQQRTIRKPLYEFLSVWDYYPDLSAKTLRGDGYFVRKILGRAEMRKLANRSDFFGDEIKNCLKMKSNGNYTPKTFEQDLKTMGTRANVNDQSFDSSGKYEVIIWKGPVSALKLTQVGVTVLDQYMADDVEAEIWMLDQYVIKADINAWRKMGLEVNMAHTFVFDEDDTSPIGNGLPNVVRDSQMSVCAATRMALDNASVVCGPNIEVNTMLLMDGQDIDSVEAYKVWKRDDDNPMSAQYPAVREIKFDGHLPELQSLVEMFMHFADMETFIGPATGGDASKQPSEPMRTAAGASMVRGDAALPFKDIVRNFDFFTQSVILSLVFFNRKFNPHLAREGDYDVIARGATSLIAKEVRGMQTDVLAQTLTPDDRDWIDEEAFMKQRMAVRDMTSLMVPEEEALRKRSARQAQMAEMSDLEKKQLEAEIRKTLAEAFKNITQGQKNTASADAATTNTALSILETGMTHEEGSQGSGGSAGR